MVKDMLQLDHVRMIYLNFTGVASKFNREGDRNFTVIIPDEETALRLRDDGWNVKTKEARDEDGDPSYQLKVSVKFSPDRPKLNPNIYLKSNGRLTPLDEESIDMLDNIDIQDVEMDIRPYNYDVNGKTGVTAYVQSMCVTQRITDRFRNDYDTQAR